MATPPSNEPTGGAPYQGAGYQGQQPGAHQQGQPYDPYASPTPAGGWSGAPPAQPRNGLGVAALVLGILAIVTCFTAVGGVLLGVLAVIFGVVGVRRAGRGAATNRGVALAGTITGALGLILGAVFVVLFVVAGNFFFSVGGGDYVSCLQRANGDQTAIGQCAQQFQQQVNQRQGTGGGY